MKDSSGMEMPEYQLIFDNLLVGTITMTDRLRDLLERGQFDFTIVPSLAKPVFGEHASKSNRITGFTLKTEEEPS